MVDNYSIDDNCCYGVGESFFIIRQLRTLECCCALLHTEYTECTECTDKRAHGPRAMNNSVKICVFSVRLSGRCYGVEEYGSGAGAIKPA